MDLPDCRSAQDLRAFALGAFVDFAGSLEKNRLEFGRQGIEPSGLFERLLGFQLYLRDRASNPNLAGIKSGRAQDSSDQIQAENYVLFMLGHNSSYLLPAVQALEQDLVAAYKCLMRPVAESIQKSFYLMGHPQAAKHFELIDLHSQWVSENPHQKRPQPFEEFLQLPGPRKLLDGKITSDEFYELRRKYSAGRVRRCLYSDKALKDQAILYAHLNSSVHANPFGKFQIRRDPVLTEHFMDFATNLSFFNLFLLANAQSEPLKELGLWEKTEQFLGIAAKDLGRHYMMANMYPDKAEYTKNLKIRLEPFTDPAKPTD